MDSEERGRSSYMDLLITTLMEHEKNLDRLVEGLEKIYKNLQATYDETSSKSEKNLDKLVEGLEKIYKKVQVNYEKVSPKAEKIIALKEASRAVVSDSDTLIFMKIKTNRRIDEMLQIIESLKE